MNKSGTEQALKDASLKISKDFIDLVAKRISENPNISEDNIRYTSIVTWIGQLQVAIDMTLNIMEPRDGSLH